MLVVFMYNADKLQAHIPGTEFTREWPKDSVQIVVGTEQVYVVNSNYESLIPLFTVNRSNVIYDNVDVKAERKFIEEYDIQENIK